MVGEKRRSGVRVWVWVAVRVTVTVMVTVTVTVTVTVRALVNSRDGVSHEPYP
jgi:hypothetical protein